MFKIMTVGIWAYLITTIFQDMGTVFPESTFTVGNAFGVLGAMIMFALLVLMTHEAFTE